MKRKLFIELLCIFSVVIALTVAVSAAGFTKTNFYAEGTFKDVKSSSWYAKEVASAYELGFMNGKAEGQFVPDGNVTVAEAITMASRVHSIYNGKEIAKTAGKWYDMYVQYALNNGIIVEGQYENFDRNIMRYEMAVMFADSMPESYFAAKNNVKAIPDVNKNEEYHDKLLMLYNAGVVMGSTEYGDFLATNSIKRSETAAIINRVALPENRLSKTLEEYGDREQAAYLMDYHTMTRSVRDRTMIASGWRYENTIDPSRDDADRSSNTLVDTTDTGYAAMHRDIATQDDGVVCLEFKYMSDNPGYSMVLSDINGNSMFTLKSNADKTYSAIGDSVQTVDYTYERAVRNVYFEFDLDNRKAKFVNNGVDAGTYNMSTSATDISRVSFLTGEKELLTFSLNEIYMYVNYTVNDTFSKTPVSEKPYGWETTGDVTVVSLRSDLDTHSVKANKSTKSVKKFDAVSGKFVYETFVRIPESQSVTLSLKNGSETAVYVNGKDGRFTCNNQLVRNYTDTIWQLVRIEGDFSKKTALIKINNKECITAPLATDCIDNIEIATDGVSAAYFDDVELYNVYDYADYCPKPVPATNDEWYVGMSVCSLWREGTHYGWDCITPYDEATPVIGYYDEGLPEVADWEIKMLVEHGYDFQHFCWYIGNSDEGIKEPRLSDALHNGYMNARYSDMQDFMIMWENANGGSIKDFASFKSYVWNYWCDWYFSDPRYFTIDNKPVLTIYQYGRFIEHLGGEEQAKEAIEFMRRDIKRLGYDNMIILFCNNGNSKSTNELLKRLGGDAVVCYNFGEEAYIAEYQKTMMNSAYNSGHISLMPSISVGFNDIGWTETRTPNATPEAYREALEWARDDYMPRIDEREDEDWKSRFVLSNTWNEYGEGHYMMPTNLNKFGYMDAVRSVFSSAAGTDDKAHFDVEPTINQRARLCYLYPNRTQLIRRTYWTEQSVTDYSGLDVILGWNFENKEDCYDWSALGGTTSPTYSEKERALVGRSLTNDPIISLLKAEKHYMDAENVQYLKVRIKYDSDIVSSSTLYFKTEYDTEYAQIRGVSKTVNGSEYADYYFKLTDNKYWKDTITDIRFDPMATEGTYLIKSIEFLGNSKAADKFIISIDGKSIKTDINFVKEENGEIFVAGNPTDGFYSLHNFYTEWNRYNGTLMLKTGTGHIFNFTVGSDIALVDGKQKKIASVFTVLDGLPYIPMTFVYNNADIDYETTGDGFRTSIRGEDISGELEKRVEYEYEFNIASDLEGWIVSAATGMVANGCFNMNASPVSQGSPDPKMQKSNVSINTALYKGAEVRVKCHFEDISTVNTPFTLYFATSGAPNLSESKTGKIYLKDLTPDKDGYYILNFDLSQHEDWKGTVTIIRFDPTNSLGTYEIDYIRMVKDPEAEKELQEKQKSQQEREIKLRTADVGKPFYIENPDAENHLVKPLSHLGYTALRIVVDPDNENNHVFEYVPSGDKKHWAYTMIPTRFKPGVTYKVELDIRVTKDHTGSPVEKAFLSWNLRYTDVVDGSYKSMADHHSSLGSFGTDDGWQHVSFTHTVSLASEIRDNDYFALFANPIELQNGSYRNIGYMIDNIKIEVVG